MYLAVAIHAKQASWPAAENYSTRSLTLEGPNLDSVSYTHAQPQHSLGLLMTLPAKICGFSFSDPSLSG